MISLTAWEAWRRFGNDCQGLEENTPLKAFKRTALQPETPIYPKMEKEKHKLTQTRFLLFVKKFGEYLFFWLVYRHQVLPTWDFLLIVLMGESHHLTWRMMGKRPWFSLPGFKHGKNRGLHDRKSLNDFFIITAETLEVHRDVKSTHACKCC